MRACRRRVAAEVAARTRPSPPWQVSSQGGCKVSKYCLSCWDLDFRCDMCCNAATREVEKPRLCRRPSMPARSRSPESQSSARRQPFNPTVLHVTVAPTVALVCESVELKQHEDSALRMQEGKQERVRERESKLKAKQKKGWCGFTQVLQAVWIGRQSAP